MQKVLSGSLGATHRRPNDNQPIGAWPFHCNEGGNEIAASGVTVVNFELRSLLIRQNAIDSDGIGFDDLVARYEGL
ncbi:MAG TPA: hypothetical protein VKZ75_01830 [Cyclobacteriaceae bacterium]|nr:hypothetical protein [Cyclobacteriaceae bacterium]